MKCKTTSTRIGNGLWQHECVVCGAVRKAPFENVAYSCITKATLRTTPLGDNKYHHACPRCDFETTTDGPEEITHDCRRPEQVSQLGDRVEAALKSVGITQERYKSWKKKLGLPPTCNCESRKKWLSAVDQEYGLTDKLDHFKSLLGF